MPKRIYSTRNKKLYQYRAGGNYYFRYADTEICLETREWERAEANLKLQLALMDRFGTTAFQFKIGQLFPQFLKDKKKEVRGSTYNSYEKIWSGYFEKRLKKVLIGDMNQRAWSDFCLQNKTVSDFQNMRNLMHQFLVWCVMKEFLLAVPILKNPKHKRRKRKVLPPELLELIFQRADGSLLLFLSMALFMGMRRSEIMKLCWDDIDLQNKWLTLSDAAVKTDEGREIPISNIVYKLLLDRLESQQKAKIKTSWVFPHVHDYEKNAPASSLMSAWRRCLLNCGLADKMPAQRFAKAQYKIVVHYTWHDLRATYEKHSHMSKDHTDTQKEKMVGADIDVQKKIYVSMRAEDLRGLEEVVTKKVPSLAKIIHGKALITGKATGNSVGTRKLKKNDMELNNGKA